MLEHLVNQQYDNILVAFDAGKQTFRHEILDSYKDGRSPMPEEMRVQIPHIKEYLHLMNIKEYQLPMYEADDIIGTMARLAIAEGYHVDIYSSDKDLLQALIEVANPNIKMPAGDPKYPFSFNWHRKKSCIFILV